MARQSVTDFFRYLLQISRHALAAALTVLGLVGEVSRLFFDGFPIPRWVDLALVVSGVVWGGYVAYRDKPLPQLSAPTGPTPRSAFYSRLSSLPRHLPMGELVIGFEIKEDLRFTEQEFDAIDEWIASIQPESVPSRSDRSFIRRQVESDNILQWHAQVDPPGPILCVDRVIQAHAIAEGTAADLKELYAFWTSIRDELPLLSALIGGPPSRVGFALQPYPSDKGPVVDLWFGAVAVPETTGAAGYVPPWQEVFDPCTDEILADLPQIAASSLLRHYGYRAVEETLHQLAGS